MFEPKPSKAHCCNCGQGRHNSSAPRVGQNALPRRVFAAATAAMVLGLGWTRMLCGFKERLVGENQKNLSNFEFRMLAGDWSQSCNMSNMCNEFGDSLLQGCCINYSAPKRHDFLWSKAVTVAEDPWSDVGSVFFVKVCWWGCAFPFFRIYIIASHCATDGHIAAQCCNML